MFVAGHTLIQVYSQLHLTNYVESNLDIVMIQIALFHTTIFPKGSLSHSRSHRQWGLGATPLVDHIYGLPQLHIM